LATEKIPIWRASSRVRSRRSKTDFEEFVTRDGTDHGEQEDTLEEKKKAVIRQLDRGEIVIVFDSESETANIVPKEAVGVTA
jgi:uncharacterized protein YheU (UPF0270 family)